jgi:hypothetical protein
MVRRLDAVGQSLLLSLTLHINHKVLWLVITYHENVTTQPIASMSMSFNISLFVVQFGLRLFSLFSLSQIHSHQSADHGESPPIAEVGDTQETRIREEI